MAFADEDGAVWGACFEWYGRGNTDLTPRSWGADPGGTSDNVQCGVLNRL
jgi:hypothetical protein